MATSPSVPAQPEAAQAVPFQFGTAVRACAGSTRTPGAFSLTWPVVRNQNVWQGGSNQEYSRIFLDPSKAPLKKS